MAVLYIYPLCAGEVRQYTSPEIVDRKGILEMKQEYIEMTKAELREYIENMPEGTVASIEMPMVEEDD